MAKITPPFMVMFGSNTDAARLFAKNHDVEFGGHIGITCSEVDLTHHSHASVVRTFPRPIPNAPQEPAEQYRLRLGDIAAVFQNVDPTRPIGFLSRADNSTSAE